LPRLSFFALADLCSAPHPLTALLGIDTRARLFFYRRLPYILAVVAITAAAVALICWLAQRLAQRQARKSGDSYQKSQARAIASAISTGLSALVILAGCLQVLNILGTRFFTRVFGEWGDDLESFVHEKLPRLLLVATIAFLLSRLLSLITARMSYVAEKHAHDSLRTGQIKTVASVIKATGIGVIVFVLLLQVLEIAGINLGPLLASAGVAGVAIGLAAQTIVKDMLNGMLLLVEDQFAVGDRVQVAGLSGNVESMTLRRTSIRGDDGTLYIVPNSQITTVANQSRDYTVATVPISVDFSAPPDRVMKVLIDVALKLRADPQYQAAFLGDPEMLGVNELKGSEIIYLVNLRTRPQQHWGAMREYKKRVREALVANGLLPGDPFRALTGRNAEALPAPQHPANPTAAKSTDVNPFAPE
jgi:small conductance mechanosensitive channel